MLPSKHKVFAEAFRVPIELSPVLTWSLANGVSSPIPTSSVPPLTKKQLASPLLSILKSTSADASLKTAPALTVKVSPSVVVPETSSVPLRSTAVAVKSISSVAPNDKTVAEDPCIN